VSDDLFQQARLRMENQQTEAAIELLEEAVLIDPMHAPSLFTLARLAETQGRDAWAKLYYERAIRSSPQAWQAHYNLARLYVLEGTDEKARLHLERAILLKPDLLDAIWLLAQVCERQLDVSEAVVWLEHLRKSDARRAEVCVALARVDPANIHSHLEAAAAMGCQRYEVLFNLGVCRWRAGDVGGAELAWRSAASVSGAGHEAAHALSAMALSDRKLTDACTLLRHHPHSALLCLLAHLHEENGEPEKAAEAWKKSIELDPDFSRRYFV
jgi:Tfp pilus assembly protein PilF